MEKWGQIGDRLETKMCDFIAHLPRWVSYDTLSEKEDNEMFKKKYYVYMTYEGKR